MRKGFAYCVERVVSAGVVTRGNVSGGVLELREEVVTKIKRNGHERVNRYGSASKGCVVECAVVEYVFKIRFKACYKSGFLIIRTVVEIELI